MRKKNIFPLLVMLCVIGTLILTVGVAQARFRENWTETLPFQAEGNENLVLQQESGWVQTQTAQQVTFSLENTDTEVAAGEIYVLVSQGLENPDKLRITLTAEEKNYTAQAQAIVPGSALHRSFGNGWVYRFPDNQGQKTIWTLEPAGEQSFVLTVEADEEIHYHSLLRLVVQKTQTS